MEVKGAGCMTVLRHIQFDRPRRTCRADDDEQIFTPAEVHRQSGERLVDFLLIDASLKQQQQQRTQRTRSSGASSGAMGSETGNRNTRAIGACVRDTHTRHLVEPKERALFLTAPLSERGPLGVGRVVPERGERGGGLSLRSLMHASLSVRP